MEDWKKSVQRIITSLIVAYSVCFVALILFFTGTYFVVRSWGMGPYGYQRDMEMYNTGGGFIAVAMVAFLVVVAFFIVYLVRLGQFARIQKSEVDRSTIINIRNGYLISTFGVGGFIFIMSLISEIMHSVSIGGLGIILGGLVQIGVCIWLIRQFNIYSQSEYLNERGVSGANLLRISMILTLVSSVCYFIPQVGSWVAFFAAIAITVTTFMGWTRIKHGEYLPEEYYEEDEVPYAELVE